MSASESGSSTAEVVVEEPSKTSIDQAEEGQVEEPSWKIKRKPVPELADSAIALPDMLEDIDETGWAKYEPPAGLKTVPDIESDIILHVIQDSIDRIKARIVEEEERRKAEAEAASAKEEEEAREESEKGKQLDAPSVTVDIVDDEPARPSSPKRNSYTCKMRTQTTRIDPDRFLAPAAESKPKKRSLFGLLRGLNHSSEQGETSAAGAARHKPNTSSSSLDLTSRKRPVFIAIKKVIGSSPKSSIDEDALVECVSCLDDFRAGDTIRAPCHNYCRDCFRRLISAACQNEQQWPPKCCLNAIPDATVLLGVDGELQRQWHLRGAEWNVPVGERVYCSEPSCSTWCPPDHINAALGAARCSQGHWTCTICRGPQHDGAEACPQDRDLQRTNELAEEEGWKRCYGCGAYVEHREACQHMTCRCGAQFCYVCGARWRTCSCTMEQLANVKREAAARRQARQDREAREEAELREALRLVAEFEREEALKAELLRQEQARVAEERRRRELEERIRREEARRAAVEAKFRDLRAALADLHEAQRGAVRRDHEAEEADLSARGARRLDELRRRHETERAELGEATAARLRERERALAREYAARVAEERRIEEQYAAQLKAYWARRGGGEAAARAALASLQRSMDRGFAAWKKWMDSELESYRWEAREEQAIREELMDDAERRAAEDAEAAREAFTYRRRAELRWVEVVVAEREGLLNEMGADELENAEDIEAWFAEDALDEPVIVHGNGEVQDLQEFPVPGAFVE
ncbi:hypothetical protein DL764_003810 [Monosporascus ibericus]|uniref:RBR-type E3 ubiquitin transferase n=1 Tax=Monosporascus ibericus TaxID=155417 RepID=A0A4Q4TF73_9PEZI|nr:hypothetical protein DL764_003810 [Monosporascus ibericus]